MKKFAALTLAVTMLAAMPVKAASSPDAASVFKRYSASHRTVSTASATPEPAEETFLAPEAIRQAAEAEGKTVGEYMNNAVLEVPGLENAVPIGQDGHVILNGTPSDQVFSVLKPTQEDVSSGAAFASALGGRVLTVVRIRASVTDFQTARVNFYMEGVTEGRNIKVFQLLDGAWQELSVAEVRKDHVVVDLTSLGTLAFVEMPDK